MHLGGLHSSPKLGTFPFCWTKKLIPLTPLLITDHILAKKVSLITCRQTLAKTLLAACIFIYTIMNYFKKLDGIKTLNTKQCLQRLSPRIIHQAISFKLKMVPILILLCYPQQVWTGSPLLASFISSARKIPLNRFTSTAIKSSFFYLFNPFMTSVSKWG